MRQKTSGGLQNRRVASSGVTGGFDPHRFRPLLSVRYMILAACQTEVGHSGKACRDRNLRVHECGHRGRGRHLNQVLPRPVESICPSQKIGDGRINGDACCRNDTDNVCDLSPRGVVCVQGELAAVMISIRAQGNFFKESSWPGRIANA